MTGGISVTKPEMSLRRQDLVLFCSLSIDALVSADEFMPNDAVVCSKKTYALILPIPRKSFYGWISSPPIQPLMLSCKSLE